MTITRQQVDAWDAEVNAAYERGRQEGMKQERALWTLAKVGQEIEAQPARTGWPEGLLQDDDRKLSKWLASKPDANHIVDMAQPEERNFCPRCGKRTADSATIHTCTPPVAADNGAFYGFPQEPVSTPNAGGKCVTAGETAPTKEIDPNAWAFDRGLEST